MNREQTLTWLADFQRSFGAALCTPLANTGGTLHVDHARYPSAACARVIARPELSAAARLGVYNRQYWLRLLNTLQRALPLTSRLFGLWSFNQRAMQFLSEHPPRTQDLESACDGFDRYLETALTRESVPCPEREAVVPRAALLEAATIDLAFKRVFLAPPQPAFQLSGEEDLTRVGLQPSAAFACVAEHWPLVRVRTGLLGPEAPHVVALPERLPAAQRWALFRTERGVGQLALEPEHARLLELLSAHTVADALARLESERDAADRETLPERVQRWLAQSVRLGFFRGMRPLAVRLPQ